MKRSLGVLATVVAVFFAGFTIHKPAVNPTSGVETIYVKNLSPQYMSDSQIKHDIPSWEQAANKDFAPVWSTPQVKIILLSKSDPAPRGAIVAYFVKSGPIQGALAYHTVIDKAPAIVVYTGVGDFYGYNNSVSFTHELEEMLADPTVSVTNQGYPYSQFCLDGSNTCEGMMPGTVWAQEVSDAVESYDYTINGVKISDFITPNWFNDEAGPGGFDFLNKLSEPFEIAVGGYSQFWNGQTWNVVMNFRRANTKDADGFLKGEKIRGLRLSS